VRNGVRTGARVGTGVGVDVGAGVGVSQFRLGMHAGDAVGAADSDGSGVVSPNASARIANPSANTPMNRAEIARRRLISVARV
jgi:hypothetical protein